MAITYFISKYIFFFNDALCEIGEPLNEFYVEKTKCMCKYLHSLKKNFQWLVRQNVSYKKKIC